MVKTIRMIVIFQGMKPRKEILIWSPATKVWMRGKKCNWGQFPKGRTIHVRRPVKGAVQYQWGRWSCRHWKPLSETFISIRGRNQLFLCWRISERQDESKPLFSGVPLGSEKTLNQSRVKDEWGWALSQGVLFFSLKKLLVEGVEVEVFWEYE